MSQPPQRLVEIAEQLKAGQSPSPETVRTLLSWFGVRKRGSWIRSHVRATLKQLGIATVPDFDSVYIDVAVRFVAIHEPEKPPVAPLAVSPIDKTDAVIDEDLVSSGINSDPTYRISRLASANRKLETVKPDTPLREATTKMLMYDYSQLPVMTNDREVKGVVSWSSIAQRLVLKKSVNAVRDCMEQHQEVLSNVSIFTAIGAIVQHQYVLVRSAEDNRITGIVTTSDLSLQFHQLAEPFLMIGEIENQIRVMIEGKFTKKELQEVRDPTDADRPVETVADLSFGEYQRLLEKPERWQKVHQDIDRKSFIENLDRVRKTRNDVMHFDPDGLPPDELDFLRDFVRFLRRLKDLTAKG